MANEVFVATNVSPGMLVRLARIRRGWRQADLANKAGVTQAEVSAIERGVYVIPAVRRRILEVLKLLEDESASDRKHGKHNITENVVDG